MQAAQARAQAAQKCASRAYDAGPRVYVDDHVDELGREFHSINYVFGDGGTQSDRFRFRHIAEFFARQIAVKRGARFMVHQ